MHAHALQRMHNILMCNGVRWRDESAEEVNARLDSLLRAVSAARGLATVSTAPAPAPAPNVNVNEYLQQAFPTIHGRQQHHPEVEQGQPSHTQTSVRTHAIGGGSAWPIGGNQTFSCSSTSMSVFLFLLVVHEDIFFFEKFRWGLYSRFSTAGRYWVVFLCHWSFICV